MHDAGYRIRGKKINPGSCIVNPHILGISCY